MASAAIRNVLILGAGTMGQKISLQCAAFGFNVTVYDIKEEFLETAKKIVAKYARQYQKAGIVKEGDVESVLARISYTTDIAAAAKDADIVNESIPEDPRLKAEVFFRLHGLCPERTIFTTNTSTLLPSQIAGEVGRPEKFLALHYHNPGLDRIVDVMPHPGTDPDITKAVEQFAKDTGMIPIMLHKENNGYVFNNMLMMLLGSALSLASKGVATPEDIDRAWMGIMHTFVGPFGIIDSVGIETVWKITDYWANVLDNPQNRKNAAMLKEYVDRKELGIKTGKGFYTYPNPAFSASTFVEKGSAVS